jgi:uncharacterized repeat protein (TIGR01451 family)
MSFSFNQFKRASAVCVALGSLIVSGQALAGGTIPGQSVDNIASVNYSVGGVPQTVIRSAPGVGNSTPGAGAGSNTSFVVDRKVDLYVQEVSGNATSPVAPGSTNQVTTFFLRNDGNDTQGVNLSAASVAGTLFTHTGTVVMTNIRYFVESTAASTGAACTTPGGAPAQPGGMQFTLGTDTATTIPTLAPDSCTWIYVVADTPANASNATWANVELTAIARVPTTLAALVANTGADNITAIDVVFADPAATVTDRDQYAIVTAAFTVIKAHSVIDDFVSTSNYKPIPGARVEYVLTLNNNGGATADTISITDALPVQTVFFPTSYNAGAANVSVTVGATTTFCIAEPGPTDGNADGCFLTTASGVTTLTVRNPAIAPVPAAGSVAVRFRVTIQ